MSVLWQGLADATIVAHYGFLIYLLIGGFVAWRWPKTIWTHLLAAVWAVLIVSTNVACPLTAAQNTFREHEGLAPLRDGFVELYVQGIFYPKAGELIAQTLAAAVVLISWGGFVRRRVVVHHAHTAGH